MLADEPTTGLDSWMAENVIKLMRYVLSVREDIKDNMKVFK